MLLCINNSDLDGYVKRLFVPCRGNGFRPLLLRKPALVVYTILLLFVNTFGGLVGIPEAMASTITPTNIIKLTNQERASLGLNTLNANSKLMAAAQAKANNMFQEQYWDHFGPNGETPWMFITQAGYQYVYAGENLAKGFRTAEGVHEAWMASPTHKENIVSRNYKDIGVAVVEGELLGKQTVLVVQMFGNLTSDVAKSPDVKSEVEKTPPTSTTPTESGQIKSIKITNPKTGALLNDANIDIKGEVENVTGEYVVEVMEGSDSVGESTSNNSTWEVDKGADWEEGEHDVYARIKGSTVKSKSVSFEIDSTPPQVNEGSISVERTSEMFKLVFTVSEECEEVKLVSGDKTYELVKGDDGNVEISLTKEDMGDRSVLMVSDKAGNISELDISEYFIEGDTQNISPNFVLWLRSMFSSTDGISLAIVSFVFILLSVEVYVYWKKGSLGKHAGDLFTIGAWWMVILVAAFKGFGGIIS